jgi:hypothetical protein
MFVCLCVLACLSCLFSLRLFANRHSTSRCPSAALTASLLGRFLVRPVPCSAIHVSSHVAHSARCSPPFRRSSHSAATQPCWSSALGQSRARSLCSGHRPLQSSDALAPASGHFLRLVVPALSRPSVRHMCHTCLHTWVIFVFHAPSHLHLHHPWCQKCLMANPHLSRATTSDGKSSVCLPLCQCLSLDTPLHSANV